MPHKRKFSDEEVRESYSRTGSIWQTGLELGACGQSVHERLVKLGIDRSNRSWTKEERDLLLRDYALYRDLGKLCDLAQKMDRPKASLCTEAKALGLTDPKHARSYIRTWKEMPEDTAGLIFDRFKKSSLGVGAFCKKMGFDDLGFSRTMKIYFADEWDYVIELKWPKQTMYRLGRSFEYRVRDLLRDKGYFVQRSPASKTPIDLIGVAKGIVLFVQCKRGGSFGVGEWNEFYRLATSCGALPIMAATPRGGRGVEFWLLTGLKDGSKRAQPFVVYEVIQAAKK